VSSVVGEEVIRLVSDQIVTKGGVPTVVALKAQMLPLFHGEQDLVAFPSQATHMAQIIRDHRSLMIIAPEYHQGIAPLIKNSLDWAARAHTLSHRSPLLQGKAIGIVTVSTETHLGVQALTQMAALCHTLGGRILPGSMGVLDQEKTLGEDRQIADKGLIKRLSALAGELAEWRSHSL
jgi:NAD(P)H-dependent FMN reductase